MPNYARLGQTIYLIISYQAKHIRGMVTYTIEKYSRYKRNTTISCEYINANLSGFLSSYGLIPTCSKSED